MRLSTWVKDTWKHITIEKVIYSQGQELRVPEINVDLTVGIISTADKEEFSKLCFHYAPVGIIVDEIPDEYYEGRLLMTRNYLTKLLVRSPNSKVAEKYLNILERRDKAHWAKEQKETKLTTETGKTGTTAITFTVRE